MAAMNFDVTNVAPAAPRTVIPAGKYLAEIIASDYKANNAGTGHNLTFELVVLDGEHAGRHLFDSLAIDNPSAQAVEIAYAKLSALSRSVGVMSGTDTEVLHNKPLMATVKVKPAHVDKSGISREARNEIGGYEAAPGGARQVASQATRAGVGAPPAASRAAPAATGPATPPWRKSAAA